jgi:BAAT / Acyl-CoA thioester hydrolase C terminal
VALRPLREHHHRRTAADPGAHIHLNYADAGHADLGPPYTPELVQYNDRGKTVHLGGTEAGYETAHLRDWRTMLRFVTGH